MGEGEEVGNTPTELMEHPDDNDVQNAHESEYPNEIEGLELTGNWQFGEGEGGEANEEETLEALRPVGRGLIRNE